MILNPCHATGFFLYPLKTSENQRKRPKGNALCMLKPYELIESVFFKGNSYIGNRTKMMVKMI